MPVLMSLSVTSGNLTNKVDNKGSDIVKQEGDDKLELHLEESITNGEGKENVKYIQENSSTDLKDCAVAMTKSTSEPTNQLIKDEADMVISVQGCSEEGSTVGNGSESCVEGTRVGTDTIKEASYLHVSGENTSQCISTPNMKDTTEHSLNKSCDVISTEIKSVPKTPIQISNTEVKNSPNTSVQITDTMIEEEEKYRKEEEQQMEKLRAEALDELERTGKQERFERLQNLLTRSQTYSTYLLGRINARRQEEQEKAEREEKRKHNEAQRKKEKEEQQNLLKLQNHREVRDKTVKVMDDEKANVGVPKRQKRKTIETEEQDTQQQAKKTRGTRKSKSKITDYNEENTPTFEEENTTVEPQPAGQAVRMINGEKVPDVQPKLLSGGVLRNYQIEGVEWLIGLFENGINGILADEMGLGKTLQSIALIAALIEKKVIGPFLIAAPLSTLPNWIAEFKRFAPQIYTILYHGSKEDRMEKRRKMMRLKKYSGGVCSLPVVITSYEIVMRDRALLSSFNVEWKYLIVDEGHRLKNLNCKLIKELKLYNTGNRLLLTGTPLQNNLAELWSLLNFLLPDIFDDLSSFQRWFDFSAMSSSDFVADEQEAGVLQTLHSILTPFLLRRLKTDVDLSIPPKKEVLVHCPMTAQQKNYYKTTLDRSILDMIKEKNEPVVAQEFTACGRPKRESTKNVNYIWHDDDEDDTFDYEMLVKEIEADIKRKEDAEAVRNKKKDRKSIVNIKLQNIMMMLRKCCNHPYLLEFPFDSATDQLIIDERLLQCSGKLLMMDKMLEGLKKRGHKVLIFSQMTLLLDIIVDYLGMKNWSYSRLDGTMNVQDRFVNIEKFNTDPDTFIFLLSTRAGGLGLNLMMADTCIIYDSDWNPQVDLQAQDRCHRIGQKRPVVIYRLVTANTIDQRIIERAAKKRKLEKMVIHEKRFKGHLDGKAITAQELIRLLDSSDLSTIVDTQNVITDEELDELLDRSDLEKMMKENLKTIKEATADKSDELDNLPSSGKSKLFTVVDTCTTDEVVF